MLELHDQIREYCDRLEDQVRPVGAAEILDRTESDDVEVEPIGNVGRSSARPFREWRGAPGWVYGIAAGVLVVLTIGGVAWLVGSDGGTVIMTRFRSQASPRQWLRSLNHRSQLHRRLATRPFLRFHRLIRRRRTGVAFSSQ